MSETSPPAKLRADYKIGDRVPMPKPQMDVRPAKWVDSPARSPKGVFRNGTR